MRIGNRNFNVPGRTYVMGILNVTPDSFSDGGKYYTCEDALKRCDSMIAEGADIIDIGGESSRPGYTPVGFEEQIERIVPVIEKIRENFDIPVSVDTTLPEVARAVIDAGADMINDISGLSESSEMAALLAAGKIPVVIMHNKKCSQNEPILAQIVNDLKLSVDKAVDAGIDKSQIIVDPGIGFGKSVAQNIEIAGKISQIDVYGLPLLLGASRKSFIGETLNLPVDERLEGTLAVSTVAVMGGVSFIRVHDIRENVRTVKMTEALLGR